MRAACDDGGMATTASGARPYGGVSGQDRRSARRDRLIEATLDLVGEDGVAAVTVGAVCGRAGVAKRYFYESFGSLDDLLSSALAQVFDRVVQAAGTRDAAVPATPREIMQVAVRGAIDAMDDARAARLYLESAGNPALLRTRDEAVDAVVALLLSQVVGDGPARPQHELTGQLLVSGATHVMALWLRGRIDLTRDDFVEHLVGLGERAALQMQADAVS